MPYNILIVDDVKNDFENCKEILSRDEGLFNPLWASNGIDVLKLLKEKEIDLIILDQRFEVSNLAPEKLFKNDTGETYTEKEAGDITSEIQNEQGLIILRVLKSNEKTKQIPVIFLTAYGDVGVGNKAVANRAETYLRKGDLSLVPEKIRSILEISKTVSTDEYIENTCRSFEVAIDILAKEYLEKFSLTWKRLRQTKIKEAIEKTKMPSGATTITLGEITRSAKEILEKLEPESLSPNDWVRFIEGKLQNKFKNIEYYGADNEAISFLATQKDGGKVSLKLLQTDTIKEIADIDSLINLIKDKYLQLDSQCVAKVLDIDKIMLEEGDPYLRTEHLLYAVQEYLPRIEFGQYDGYLSIRDYLNWYGEFPSAQVAEFLDMVLKGLINLENSSLSHQNLRPENILIKINDKREIIDTKIIDILFHHFIDFTKFHNPYRNTSLDASLPENAIDYSSLCLVCHEMLTEELPEKTEKLPTNVNELKKFFEDHRKEIAKRMSRATFIALGEPVNDFERIVRQKLKPLPSGWVVLTNGRFKRLDKKGANPKDIDVVILTPYQAYSIEIRSYKSFNGEKIKILIDNTKESYNCLKEINNTI
ncbi:NERD domain-containing protein, partial [bacterium]|nr:NERD domain-containing protein [bacterium]MBU1615231.1 NERD domain-containing protein [bacterium]